MADGGLERMLQEAEKDMAAATTKIWSLRSCLREPDLNHSSSVESETSASHHHLSSGSEAPLDMAPCGGENCAARLAAANEEGMKWRAEAERLRRELVHTVRDAGFASELESTWRAAMGDLQEDLEICSMMIEEAVGGNSTQEPELSRARAAVAVSGRPDQPLGQLLSLQRTMRRLMLSTMKLQARSNRLANMVAPASRIHHRAHTHNEQDSLFGSRPSTANTMLPDLPEGELFPEDSLVSTGPPTHRRSISDPIDIPCPGDPPSFTKPRFLRSSSSGSHRSADRDMQPAVEGELVKSRQTSPGELEQPSASPAPLDLSSVVKQPAPAEQEQEQETARSMPAIGRVSSLGSSETGDATHPGAAATLKLAYGHRRSVSVQGTDSSGRTTLSKLIITGTMHHGGVLIAKGVQHGGKRCLFQWFVTPVGGTDWQTVRGARRPDLRTTLADVGCKFRCDAVPVAEDGAQGVMRSAFSKVITLDPSPGNSVQQKLKEPSQEMRFTGKLYDKESNSLDGSPVVLSISTIMLSVRHAADGELRPAEADREILSVQLQNSGTGPPPVIVVMDRTNNVLKIATIQRAGSPVSVVAQSSKEQGMIAVAIKTLYPEAAIIPSDYKVHVKGILSRKSSHDVTLVHTEGQREAGGSISCSDAPAHTETTEAALRLSMGPLASHLKTPSPSTPVNDTPPAVRAPFSAGDALSGTSRLLFDNLPPQQLEFPDQLETVQAGVSALASPLGQQGAGVSDAPALLPRHGSGSFSSLPISGMDKALLNSTGNTTLNGHGLPPSRPKGRASMDSTAVRHSADMFQQRKSFGDFRPAPQVDILDLTSNNIVQAPFNEELTEPEQLISPTSTEGGERNLSLPLPADSKNLSGTMDSFPLASGGPPSLQGLSIEGKPLVGSMLTVKHAMPSNVSHCLYQWQRIFDNKAGIAYRNRLTSTEANSGMETVFGADGPEYVVTPDDVGAVIRACCVPVDLSGLKGLTSYICLNEGNPVSLPKPLQQQVASYQTVGCGVFQVQSSRGQGLPYEPCVFTVDSKSMSLRSKSGRTIVREKYHTQLADFQLSQELDSAKLIVVNKSSAPVVVIHLKFEDNLQRDTATLLLRSLAGADAVRRKDASSGSIKGIGFLRRGLSASLTSI